MTSSPTAGVSEVMKFFPKEKPRPSQTIVVNEIDKAFSSGKKIIILEGPVGCGKSAIAMTLALYEASKGDRTIELEDGSVETQKPVHLLTPRKSLQDQYYGDFKEKITLMKGRSSYPCIYGAEVRKYAPILKMVRDGRVRTPYIGETSCAEGPCKDSETIFQKCVEEHPCPYSLAISVAQQSDIIVHNLHSFLFQTNFSGKFEKRRLMVVDEAHDVPGIIRDHATKAVKVKAVISRGDIQNLKGVAELCSFLSQPKFIPAETPEELLRKQADKEYVTEKEAYLQKVEEIYAAGETSLKEFSVELEPKFKGFTEEQIATVLHLVPHNIGGLVFKLLLNYGEKILLMSGTIYSKQLFCKEMGINPEDAYFIRIPSAFPKEKRPIYMNKSLMVNTSHRDWDQNFPKIIESIGTILEIFKNDKGLIHAPSYSAAARIVAALDSPRVHSHEPQDFQHNLGEFFSSKGNGVFVSPVCQQGVDFKEDRARFQIIVRVPYANAGSAFVSDKMKKDFSWYNYQALIVFGQQVGRVNRSPDDFGATFLLDDRFPGFIQKNKSLLPKWLTDAIIVK